MSSCSSLENDIHFIDKAARVETTEEDERLALGFNAGYFCFTHHFTSFVFHWHRHHLTLWNMVPRSGICSVTAVFWPLWSCQTRWNGSPPLWKQSCPARGHACRPTATRTQVFTHASRAWIALSSCSALKLYCAFCFITSSAWLTQSSMCTRIHTLLSGKQEWNVTQKASQTFGSRQS